jgi:hypothetical protein
VRAKTAPRPEDAPVTIATRPSSRNMSKIVRSLTGGLLSSGRAPTVSTLWGSSLVGRVGRREPATRGRTSR